MMHESIATARSLLFVPGNRAERFERAAGSGADAVILDLEDAVPENDKAAARESVRAWLDAGRHAIVRVGAVSSGSFDADMDALAGTDAVVMLAKADAVSVRDVIARGFAVLPLIETAAAVLQAREIAGIEGVVRLSVGHLDLAAELGVDPDDRHALLFSRSTLVAASVAAGLPAPVDGVTARVRDSALATDDARYAKTLGFSGKLCVHPAQVEPVHVGLQPSAADIAWSDQVLSAGTESVSVVGEQMVDRPVLLRALAIRAATRSASPESSEPNSHKQVPHA